MGKLSVEKIDGVLATIKSLYADANEAIEGPNEYDNTHTNARPEAADADWPATLKAYTQALYEKVKADPALKDRPVIGPSMAHASNAPKVPELSEFITFGNMHPYPGGWNPSRQMDDYNIPKTKKMNGERIVWATESGYQNAMEKPLGGHNPCPPDVAGKYGPRLVAEYFRRGFGRVYFYELLDQHVNLADQEANFGLLNNDLSEKPIFAGLKAMIALLKSPAADAKAAPGDAAPRGAAAAAPFTPGTLAYSLTPAPQEIRQVLLQRRDGRFFILVWQEVACYDAAKRTPIAVEPRPATLTFAADVKSVRTYLPTSHGTTVVDTFDQQKTLSLAIPDELMLIEVTPMPAQ